MSDVTLALLDRRLFSIGEASDLLEVPRSTLVWWLQGLKRGKYEYPPVLRGERNDDSNVAWGEFVEASLLRQLRDRGVKLKQIREFVDVVRRSRGWRYPLARHDLYVAPDKQLLYEAQRAAGIEGDAALVVVGQEYAEGQQTLGEPVKEFLDRVKFEDGVPVRFHPDRQHRDVVVDPQRRFGAPQVRGVPTEALYEARQAGERVEGLAEDFDLSVGLVREAIEFEERLRGHVAA